MRMRLGIFGLVLFIAAYITSVVLYAQSGMDRTRQVSAGAGAKAKDGIDVTVDVEEIQSKSSLLAANLTINPGSDLVDPLTHALKQDITLVATSVSSTGKRTFHKGTQLEVVRISGALDGEVADWPFDHYHTG